MPPELPVSPPSVVLLPLRRKVPPFAFTVVTSLPSAVALPSTAAPCVRVSCVPLASASAADEAAAPRRKFSASEQLSGHHSRLCCDRSLPVFGCAVRARILSPEGWRKLAGGFSHRTKNRKTHAPRQGRWNLPPCPPLISRCTTLIFSTKNREPWITPRLRSRLHEYWVAGSACAARFTSTPSHAFWSSNVRGGQFQRTDYGLQRSLDLREPGRGTPLASNSFTYGPYRLVL